MLLQSASGVITDMRPMPAPHTVTMAPRGLAVACLSEPDPGSVVVMAIVATAIAQVITVDTAVVITADIAAGTVEDTPDVVSSAVMLQ